MEEQHKLMTLVLCDFHPCTTRPLHICLTCQKKVTLCESSTKENKCVSAKRRWLRQRFALTGTPYCLGLMRGGSVWQVLNGKQKLWRAAFLGWRLCYHSNWLRGVHSSFWEPWVYALGCGKLQEAKMNLSVRKSSDRLYFIFIISLPGLQHFLEASHQPQTTVRQNSTSTCVLRVYPMVSTTPPDQSPGKCISVPFKNNSGLHSPVLN